MTPSEQDRLLRWSGGGATPQTAWARLKSARQRSGTPAPSLTTVRKLLNGKTHRRSQVETRGRKPLYSRAKVMAMNRKRVEMIKKTQNSKQITWGDLQRAARAPKGHATTVARAFQREGLDVRLRPIREKPQRAPEHEKERMDLCGKMRRYPRAYFSEKVDLIIDNKRFDTPTTPAARLHLQKQKMRSQLRTPAEGLQPGFTKPNAKRHRMNCGGVVDILAGISGDRVVLWEEVKGRWNAEKATAMYRGPIVKFLRKKNPTKESFLLVEDNDPTGYKSRAAIAAKKELGIRAMKWPRYSPDLMPLDFSLWANISKRMDASAPSGRETADDFKKRLRRVALSTPRASVADMVGKIRGKATEIWAAKGKDIRSD